MCVILENNDLDGVKKLIEDLEIVCLISGMKNWMEVCQFNLMFFIEMGFVVGDVLIIYLCLEIVQGIFVNFLNVQKSGCMKIFFGIV